MKIKDRDHGVLDFGTFFSERIKINDLPTLSGFELATS